MDGGNGFLKMVGAGVVGSLLGVAGTSSQPTALGISPPGKVATPAVQDVVMARRFSLRDDKGVERAVLAFGDNGEPGMFLFDPKGGNGRRWRSRGMASQRYPCSIPSRGRCGRR
jgi:hypothetical protein